ncbi:MAG: hypothetical protein ACTSWP_10355 [Candidatus Freyarchaeota archaeon]|nr:hypothetical protein [Candidatus Freyrarchaeum guaymaensis]
MFEGRLPPARIKGTVLSDFKGLIFLGFIHPSKAERRGSETANSTEKSLKYCLE